MNVFEVRPGVYSDVGMGGKPSSLPSNELAMEILNLKGNPHQAMKLVEELHELAIAVMNTLSSSNEEDNTKIQVIKHVLIINNVEIQKGISADKITYNGRDQAEILFEMADVFIVLNQMLKVFDTDGIITNCIKIKENKLRNYIDEDKKLTNKEEDIISKVKARFDEAISWLTWRPK